MRDHRLGSERPIVLVAVHDVDLREHVIGVLDGPYHIVTVADGVAALAAALEQTPDLILTGVMVPRVDFVSLLTALRADPRTRSVPVIMLSASAEDDSLVAGMQCGADDFLVKPFSAGELSTRVMIQLDRGKIRRDSSTAIQSSEERFRALVSASSDVVYRMNANWTEMRHLDGRDFIADTHEPERSWLEKYIHPDDRRRVTETIQEAIRTKSPFELEHQVVRIDGTLGWTLSRAIPMLDNDGTVVEWFGMASDVTARRQAQAALRESEQELRALFESMDEGYCVIEMSGDGDGGATDYRFLRMNAAFEKQTGVPNAEGKRLWAVDPDHEARWVRVLERVAVTGEVIRFIDDARDVGGRAFDVYAFRLGGIGSRKVAVLLNDISERMAREHALESSEARRSLALEAAELGMWHVDPATRATKTDARYRAIFGTTEYWTDYLQAVAVIHPDDQAAVLKAVTAATRLDNPVPFAIEYRVVHPDGSLRWIEATGRTSFSGTGAGRRAASFDGTVADITVRKQGEQEREQLVARLQEQDQRKDEFLATLAHELRNPLAPICNGLQLMRLTEGDADASERTRAMIERQVGQMVHLLDDLLDASRISSGRITLRLQRIELTSAIAQAIEISRPFIDQCGHQLSIDVPPGPIHVNGDLTRLAQVFSNVLNNAAKYTPRGGHIRLLVQQVGSEAVVSVTDDGIGIPADMLTKIFDMFTQFDRNLEQSQSGLGIGLSIVSRLVELHGGSVAARSDGDGTGSEFVVRLPVDRSGVVPEPRGEAAAVPATKAAAYRILVVDDNVDSAESLARILQMMGHETRTAHDGLEALDVAAAFRPTVMMLDIGLPKLDGVEVCRRIRQQAWGKEMVVIAVTGWGQDADKRRTLAAGADAHLVKPVAPAVLEQLLAELLGERA